MAIQDSDLLQIIKNEKVRSLGYDVDDNGATLQSERQTALDYFKGNMKHDMPHFKGRSGVVDSAVADAIEQVLPDLVEIYLDEDVCSFVPENEADMDQAAQETDVVNHVLFNQNDGFQLLQIAFKDALLMKTGVWMWYWEDGKLPDTQVFKGQTILEVQNVTQTAMDQIVNGQAGIVLENPGEIKKYMKANGINDPQDPRVLQMSTFTFTLQPPRSAGRVKIQAWAPEDMAVSEDTKKLGDGTYCGFRTRVRRQELLEDGYDPDTVESLPNYTNFETTLQYARDTAGESESMYNAIGGHDMDLVEVYYHYVRIYDEGKMKIIHAVTGGDQLATLLKREEVDSVPAAAITPFVVPHRFYGLSLADKLLEIQRIKTSLLRMLLDSGYYAMNQRMVVAQEGSSMHTLSDILANSPGAPIRVKSIGAVTPVQGGQINFDIPGAIELVSTMAEQRSGVARNQQGLNPDSLHETAGGALAQMSRAQLRTRFIARNFAETGFKQLCIGIHKMLRENATVESTIRLRGKWVVINPGKWHLRDDMDIEIGNAGGREQDVAMLTQVMNIQQKAIQAQGGLIGPLTNPTYLLQAAQKLTGRMGIKNPDLYFPDPANVQPPAPPAPPIPDPKIALEQASMQTDLQKTQLTLAQKTQQANQDYEINKNKVIQDHAQFVAQINLQQQAAQQAQQQFELEMQFKREQMLRTIELEQQSLSLKYSTQADQFQQELELKRQTVETEAELESQRLHTSDENAKLTLLQQQEQSDKDRTASMIKHMMPPVPAPVSTSVTVVKPVTDPKNPVPRLSNPDNITVSPVEEPKLSSLDSDFALSKPVISPPKP